MTKTYFFAGLILLLAGCSKNSNPPGPPPSKADVYFMQTASYSNWGEVVAGGIAAVNGNLDSVKMFGGMMVQDHGKAEASLTSIALSLKVSIPQTPDAEHLAKDALLKTLYGYTFDTAYINGQVIDHIKTIAAFNQEISGGVNTAVVNYAKTNLPTIEMHLQEALAIQTKLK